jgi:hypothetical protein
MLIRFGTANTEDVRAHAQNAVNHLWKGGVESIKDLGLSKTGTYLEIPWDTTLLLMGVTSQLTNELTAEQGRGTEAFIAELVEGRDTLMTKVASRKVVTEDGKIGGTPHTFSVIALHSGFRSFNGSWQGILESTMGRPRAWLDDLIKELPRIRKFKVAL